MGNKGSPLQVNYGPNNLARFCALTSWLSQWSPETRGYSPACLRRTTVPILQLEYTADESILPAHVAEWNEAATGRVTNYKVVGANHYLKGQQNLVEEVADRVTAWTRKL